MSYLYLTDVVRSVVLSSRLALNVGGLQRYAGITRNSAQQLAVCVTGEGLIGAQAMSRLPHLISKISIRRRVRLSRTTDMTLIIVLTKDASHGGCSIILALWYAKYVFRGLVTHIWRKYALSRDYDQIEILVKKPNLRKS